MRRLTFSLFALLLSGATFAADFVPRVVQSCVSVETCNESRALAQGRYSQIAGQLMAVGPSDPSFQSLAIQARDANVDTKYYAAGFWHFKEGMQPMPDVSAGSSSITAFLAESNAEMNAALSGWFSPSVRDQYGPSMVSSAYEPLPLTQDPATGGFNPTPSSGGGTAPGGGTGGGTGGTGGTGGGTTDPGTGGGTTPGGGTSPGGTDPGGTPGSGGGTTEPGDSSGNDLLDMVKANFGSSSIVVAVMAIAAVLAIALSTKNGAKKVNKIIKGGPNTAAGTASKTGSGSGRSSSRPRK